MLGTMPGWRTPVRPVRRGFTLVELMIVVAIMMVLAAVAIPQFHSAQMRAKKAEIDANLAGILDAAAAYNAALDGWGTTAPWQPGPGGPMGYWDKQAHPWDDGSIPQTFIDLGWEPDGAVRASYSFQTNGTTFVRAVARSDMDDDGFDYYRRDDLDPVSYERVLVADETCIGGGDPLSCF